MNTDFDKTKNSSADYDELLKSFSAPDRSNYNPQPDSEIKNHGEVYFSSASRSERAVNSAQRKTSAAEQKKNVSAKPSVKKSGKRKKRKKSNLLESILMSALILVFVLIASLMLKIPIMACINDVLAIDVSDVDYRVVLDKDMPAEGVIDVLAEKNLISNPGFCKLFTHFRGYDKQKEYPSGNYKERLYPAGTYILNSAMGVEGMLHKILNTGISNTVTLTFPEGLTVSQIVQKLSENGVATAEGLYKEMENEELIAKYNFLSAIKNPEERFALFEGYLYPDTYEFYIGEAPSSVLEKFLDNFKDKWTGLYAEKAKELGFTMDEIITIASVIQKEAFNSEQMPVIASVIYNRLKSSSFIYINCDSTGDYIKAHKEALEKSGDYEKYMENYDTYQKTGLPSGPVCCPGNDAIFSALNPDSTNLYYFCHAADGTMYTAKTEEEHERNKQHIK